ncbi:MAG: hypothetical protein ACTHM8_11190 [Sphingomonas sp.]
MSYFRKLARRAVLASATLGLIATAAASAQAKDGRRDAPADQKYEVVKSKDGTVKYCTYMPPVTGTRLGQTICKTQDQWKASGVVLNVQ